MSATVFTVTFFYMYASLVSLCDGLTDAPHSVSVWIIREWKVLLTAVHRFFQVRKRQSCPCTFF
jgi:hypothetical protein